MKNLLLLLLLATFISCTEKPENKETNQVETIAVFGGETGNIPWEDFVEKIEIVPLETSSEALFPQTSSIYVDNNIYVFSYGKNLSVFSKNGKFLHKVGQKGKGPEEWTYIKDFQVDSIGNVYLTDIGNIKKYNSSGRWLSNINLKEIEGDLNSIQSSCIFDKDNFYSWQRSGVSDIYRPENDFFIHQIKNNKTTANKGIKIISESLTVSPRFTPTEEGFYVSPIWYDTSIYLIKKNSIELKYSIDFGDKKLDSEFLSKIKERDLFVSLPKAKGKCFRIENFWNQGEYLFFNFVNQDSKYSFSFYNTESKKIYTSDSNGSHLYNIPIKMRCFERNKNIMIASVEPYAIKNLKEPLNKKLLNLMSAEDLQKIEDLNETDNTIIIRLILK